MCCDPACALPCVSHSLIVPAGCWTTYVAYTWPKGFWLMTIELTMGTRFKHALNQALNKHLFDCNWACERFVLKLVASVAWEVKHLFALTMTKASSTALVNLFSFACIYPALEASSY